VKKDAIGSVTTTDETHVCCGKQLLVVEIEFLDETLSDVFGQLVDSARQSEDAADRLSPRGLPVSPVIDYLRPHAWDTESLLAGYRINHLTGAPLNRGIQSTGSDRCAAERVNCLLRCGSDLRCQCYCENAYTYCKNPLCPPEWLHRCDLIDPANGGGLSTAGRGF
jgi:hypothetical protein